MRKFLLATTALAAFAGAAQAEVVVMSWGGDYGAGQEEAFNRPFTEATGIKSSMLSSDNPTALVKSMVEANNVTVDVVEFETPDAIRGCDEGLLEPIDPAILPPAPDGTSAVDDFLPGAITECGIAENVYSFAFAYDTTKLAEGPTTIADLFDLQKFPGKRALRKQAKFALEWALLADGVPPGDVYEALSTPEGLDRAFAKLGTIKSEVVWYEANAEGPRLLADGEVAMSTGPANRFINARLVEGAPFQTVWDGQIYDFSMFVIPKGAPHLENAMKFVAYVSETESLARLATILPAFGPPRDSAVPLVHLHKDGTTDLRPHMPTNPDNMENALAVSVDFWVDYQAEIDQRFNAWLVAN